MDAEQNGDRLTLESRGHPWRGWLLRGLLVALVVGMGYSWHRLSQPPSLEELTSRADQAFYGANYAEAERLLFLVLAEQERTVGLVHTDLIPTLIKLGMVLDDKGDFLAAGQMYRRELAIAERAGGPLSSELVEARSRLGNFYFSHDDLTAAESVFRAGMEAELDEHNPAPPFHNGCTLNLAAIHCRRKEFLKAAALLRRAVDLFERKAGAHNDQTVTLLMRLGQILDDLGDHVSAEQTLQSALNRCIQANTEWKANTLTLHQVLLYHFQKIGQTDRFEAGVRHLLKLSDQHWQPKEADNLFCQSHLAISLMLLGQLPEAERIQMRVVQEFEHLPGAMEGWASGQRDQLEVIRGKRRELAAGK